jgi:N6-adenosine-specific RNA methylase IME4
MDMNMESYLAAASPTASLIGIWITNKHSIRSLVLGSDGLFAQWGVTLIEEWIWVKTTLHGEPVTAVDGVWRKPYEVFLLGRKIDNAVDAIGSASITRRVIVGIPDQHSRKPCLKELLERLVLPQKYEALEVFARSLTAGWHSWGDQVLMFNWTGHWTEKGVSATS